MHARPVVLHVRRDAAHRNQPRTPDCWPICLDQIALSAVIQLTRSFALRIRLYMCRLPSTTASCPHCGTIGMVDPATWSLRGTCAPSISSERWWPPSRCAPAGHRRPAPPASSTPYASIGDLDHLCRSHRRLPSFHSESMCANPCARSASPCRTCAGARPSLMSVGRKHQPASLRLYFARARIPDHAELVSILSIRMRWRCVPGIHSG